MEHHLTFLLPRVLSIFGLSFFSFWPAMPAGIALGLHPLIVIATTTLSYASGVVLALLVGSHVARLWRKVRRISSPATGDSHPTSAESTPASRSRLHRVLNRFGAQALGLLAPMTIGSHTGALMGRALHMRRWVIVVWMTLGALAWSVILTVAALLGLGQ
ncbi:MAG: hypothetical protein Kow0077_13030 [Anaerolineae bacterium]